jgi:heme/copper-type cytochrome/quinol oxidase subunit 3
VPLIFGVLSITFSGVMLFFLLMGAGTYMLARHGAPPEIEAQRRQEVRTEVVIVTAYVLVVSGPMAAVLLAVGIGQVRYRRWALGATRLWSGAALTLLGAHTLYVLLVTKDQRALIPLSVFLALYPLLQLLFFARRQTRAAMTRRT